MRDTILCGDALAMLQTMPSNHVQCVVTSPPYFGLRDYGVDGQIGLEDTPDAYIARLVEVFREVRRVLREDGTLWVNIGDSYSTTGKKQGIDNMHDWSGDGRDRSLEPGIKPSPMKGRAIIEGMKPKDLIGIPWLLAFALRADGWYLRSDVIWHKPNAMPESVTDRPTSAHEHVFLLAKNARYFYDADAIREPGQEWNGSAGTFARSAGKNTYAVVPVQSHASHRIGRNDRVPTGRNKRNVWTIASQPYSEAHFATFPPKLIEPCILAGTSHKACEVCGAAWERVTERERIKPAMPSGNREIQRWNPQKDTDSVGGRTIIQYKDWQPTCTHANTGSGKCIVLDPFMGAGTVALVALQHNRSYLGIELNPAYCTLIRERIAEIQPELWSA